MRSPAQWLLGLLLLGAGLQLRGAEGPVAWWRFDDQTALDSASGVTNALEGNYKFMPGGVRGGCLRFDGFTTLVRGEAARVPDLSKGFTFQGWVVLAVYLWNWTFIIV